MSGREWETGRETFPREKVSALRGNFPDRARRASICFPGGGAFASFRRESHSRAGRRATTGWLLVTRCFKLSRYSSSLAFTLVLHLPASPPWLRAGLKYRRRQPRLNNSGRKFWSFDLSPLKGDESRQDNRECLIEVRFFVCCRIRADENRRGVQGNTGTGDEHSK